MGSAESYLRVTNMTDKSCTSHVWNVNNFDFENRDPMKFDGMRFDAGQSHRHRIERNPRANGNMFNLKLSFSHNKYLEFRIDQGRATRGTGEFRIYGDTAWFDVNYYSGDKTLSIDVRNSQYAINQDAAAEQARQDEQRKAAEELAKLGEAERKKIEELAKEEVKRKQAENAKKEAEEAQERVTEDTIAKLKEMFNFVK